jgi:pimeloyl-ACP methyl ester carboxylesterase
VVNNQMRLRILQHGLRLVLACLMLSASPAIADTPGPSGAIIETIRHGALDLKARHVRPPGTGLDTIILVHDALGGFESTLIAELQTALAKDGLSTLAINLSLGVSARMTAFECNERHLHRYEDALEEIDAWADWLLGEGLGPVALVGHGRGGAQVAWYLAKTAGKRVNAAILLAPSGWTPRSADLEYRARYTNGIAALLTRIASFKPDDYIDNVPFLHCGSVVATRASINSYYGVEPKRDAPTVLANVKTPVLALLPDPLSDNDDVTKRLSAIKNQFVSVRSIPGSDTQFSSYALPIVVKAIEAYLQSLRPSRK